MTSWNGLVALGCIFFLCVALFTLFLVRRYARPGCPLPVLVFTYLSWLIVFSIGFIVPLDIVPSFAMSLSEVWKTLFWASFLLTWFIIPFASGYYDNGGFT